MIWKQIPNYNEYLVSQTGIVKNTKTGREKKLTIDNYGYFMFCITKNYKQKAFRMHRLLAQLFIENPNRYEVINHKDGNKLNNSLDNLEWCDYTHNNRHAFKTGLNMHYGENNTQARITNKIALKIKSLLEAGMSLTKISKDLNVSYNIVKNIRNGKNWNKILRNK